MWAHLVTKSAKGFGLGVPIDGVEDPVVPSVFLHDAFLQDWTASGSPSIAAEAFEAGAKGASLDRSDQPVV